MTHTITLIGGPKNDEQVELATLTAVLVFNYKIEDSPDEPGRIVTIQYHRVPGQSKYYIFEPYYKPPLL